MSAIGSQTEIPLCVDMDGSLTPVDTLHESLLDMCRRSPLAALAAPLWVLQGKASFKSKVAAASDPDLSLLPLRENLLVWLKEQHAKGRRIVLATAANRKLAEQVAARVGIFDEVIASSEDENLAGERKRLALVARFGDKGYDYVGNDAKDIQVWKSARRAIVVGGKGLAKRAQSVAEVEQVFAPKAVSFKTWLKAIRVHQWVKNVLVFVPAIVSHRILESQMLLASVLAFLAFGLCASSVYIFNDLLDLPSDRAHPRKSQRPFAAGLLPARDGALTGIVLVLVAACVALTVGPWFFLALLGYYVLTWAYSLSLKRKALVDVITLAGLYTLRIIAGAAATLIAPSFWLLAFSMFVFLCLGIVKRYAELHDARQAGKLGSGGRGYTSHDLELLLTIGMASGFSAVVVMALYINSVESQRLYHRPQVMWLICPLLLYWIMRMWLLATRGQMEDDPVVFTLRDRISLFTVGLVGVLAVAAI